MRWFSKDLSRYTQHRMGPSCKENTCGAGDREIALAAESISRLAINPTALALVHF